MPPFDIDIYSLLPIMKYERDRQYCLYKNQKIMSRLGQSFRRVSHSTNHYIYYFRHYICLTLQQEYACFVMNQVNILLYLERVA